MTSFIESAEESSTTTQQEPLFFQSLCFVAREWLEPKTFRLLDRSITNHQSRRSWFGVLRGLSVSCFDEWKHCLSSLKWVSKRGITLQKLVMRERYYHLKESIKDVLGEIDLRNVRFLSLSHHLDVLAVNDVTNLCSERLETVVLEYSPWTVVTNVEEDQEVRMANARAASDAAITQLSSRHPQLKQLLFPSSSYAGRPGVVSNGCMEALGVNCRGLEAINLETTDVGIDGIMSLLAGCGSSLKQLTLPCKYRLFEDSDIQQILKAAPALEMLSIREDTEDNMTFAAFEGIGVSCPKLQTLVLSWVRKLGNKGLQSIAQCGLLQQLEIPRCNWFGDKGVCQIFAYYLLAHCELTLHKVENMSVLDSRV